MSDREAAEQGACNDCAGRDDVSPGYAAFLLHKFGGGGS